MMRLLTLLARFESHVPASGRPTACKLRRLPRLLILSDHARGYDLAHQRNTWLSGRGPSGAAFIERTYGKPVTARPKSKHRSKVRGDMVLATCSIREARKAQLSGVHWPQSRLSHRFVSKSKGMIETTSAHSGLSIAKAVRLGMDGVLVSTAFPSQSPSATRPLGALKLARLQRAFPGAPLYALGGVNLDTTKLLLRTQIYGVALVSFGLG